MIVVLDANVLLRLTDPTSVSHAVAMTAVASLRSQGHSLAMVPQSVYEFWAVATRPVANNGLGLSIAECSNEVGKLKGLFPVLDDRPGLFSEWEIVVFTFACQAKVAHDARYVAAMRRLGVTHLMTFNVGDFARYPALTILDPNTVAALLPGKDKEPA